MSYGLRALINRVAKQYFLPALGRLQTLYFHLFAITFFIFIVEKSYKYRLSSDFKAA